MLTPYFELSQTDDKLFIIVHAPYSNISDAEIYVDKNDFRFWSSPYYLRLNLPGSVKDSDEPNVKYNSDNGQFNIELIKSTAGEHFNDLDLIARFLSPGKKKASRVNIKPDIQVLDSSTLNDGEDEDEDEDEEDSSDEWLIDQQQPSPPSLTGNNIRYGFANQSQHVFNVVRDTFDSIFDITNAEEVEPSERANLRIQDENDQFDDDRYLCDLMEPVQELKDALKYQPHFTELDNLSGSELERLKDFGNKEYLLTKDDVRVAYLSLIDIVFGYAYDQRTTLGESTVESAWTINKLSATLSWLQTYTNVKEVLLSCVRRALCFPLFRHWQLAVLAIKDTINIFRSGNRRVLRCLLHVHQLFNKAEPRYILNQLYITDYCVWLQQHSTSHVNNKLNKLAQLLEQMVSTLEKGDVGLDIDILEVSAYSTLEESLVHNLDGIRLGSPENLQRQRNTSGEHEDSSDSDDSDSDSSSLLDSDDDDDDDVEDNYEHALNKKTEE